MLVRPLVRSLIRPSVGPHITSKTDYVAIASRREGRGNQLMSKTGYVEIASRLVTVARSCFLVSKEESHLLGFQGTVKFSPSKQFPSKQIVLNKELSTEGMRHVVPVGRKSQ
jgi:hypothetical protein